MSGKATIHIENAYCHKPAELKDSQSGKPIAIFTLMTSTDKRNATGGFDRGPTTFWNCVAFGSMAQKAGEILTGGVRGVDAVGVWTADEYQGKIYNKVLIFEQGGSLSLHGSQRATGHEKAKANGYMPEPEEPEDADIPF
jgi:single-stranded DNA-binding protein